MRKGKGNNFGAGSYSGKTRPSQWPCRDQVLEASLTHRLVSIHSSLALTQALDMPLAYHANVLRTLA